MMRKMLSALLVLSVLFTGLVMVPTASAQEYVSARTTLSGSSSAKIDNIRLAVEAVNGVYLSYGDTFSFNDTVGPRTESYGYQAAANGRGARVTGGGVSQVATTLYLALLDVGDGIEYVDLDTYGSRFADNYVSDGNLAVITDYSAGTDFSFVNYADDMYIEMWTSDSYVYCSITLGGASEDSALDSGWSGNWGNAFGATGQIISSASLYCGDEQGVLTNVDIAASCIYDTTLNSDDVFSFNDIVGPRTEKYGYVSATNGRGVKVTGGGVAQVASAIWLAVKDVDDIAIVEKNTYGSKYNQDYVSNSSDAILTDYKAGTDFSFRYAGSGTITIYTWLDGQTLYCQIQRN